jgi:hypothetical protein
MDEALATALAQAALDHLRQQHPALYRRTRRIGPHTFRYLKAKTFLKRYCRAVYGSGFKAAIVQAKFPTLKQAFHHFDLDALARMESVAPALAVLGNTRKARCFLQGAQAIAAEGFIAFKRRLRRDGLAVLQELPGIGPVTQYQLAKDIGLMDIPKPDVWLRRMAALCDANNVFELVAYMAEMTGESQRVIDAALWRYAVDGKLIMGKEPANAVARLKLHSTP